MDNPRENLGDKEPLSLRHLSLGAAILETAVDTPRDRLGDKEPLSSRHSLLGAAILETPWVATRMPAWVTARVTRSTHPRDIRHLVLLQELPKGSCKYSLWAPARVTRSDHPQ